MHRMASAYPLPCDDLEQQVSSPSLQAIFETELILPIASRLPSKLSSYDDMIWKDRSFIYASSII